MLRVLALLSLLAVAAVALFGMALVILYALIVTEKRLAGGGMTAQQARNTATNGRTGLRQPAGDGQANARRRPGDQGQAAIEPESGSMDHGVEQVRVCRCWTMVA